jgi:hypothetical protein
VKNSQFEKKFDDFFFCPPPETLVRTHYPLKPADQFLDTPIPLAQFKSWPKVEVRPLVRYGFAPSAIRDKLAHRIQPVEAFLVPCPLKVQAPLEQSLDSRPSYTISRHGLAMARGRLENQLADLVFPPKTNAANERLSQHLWAHRDELFPFLRQPGLDATNWRAELAIRFGVLLRKVWGGSRTWAGARAQSVLMLVW